MLSRAMSGFHGPVELVLRRSAVYLRVWVIAHGLALSGVLLCYPHSPARSLLLFVLITNGWRGMYAWWYPRADTVAALRLSQTGDWLLHLRDGRMLSAQLAAVPWISAHVTALSLRTADRHLHHVVLWPDTSDADGVRRLRVRLRAGGAQASH